MIGEPSETAANALITKLSAKEPIQGGIKVLETKLPRALRYHVSQHSKEVLRDALIFGIEDGLQDHELELLAIAAIYHDLGFLKRRGNNEAIGASMAREAMRISGYKETDIVIVENMILDTRMYPSESENTMKQNPRSKLSKYLCDADLGNFGMKYFLSKTLLMYSEITRKDFRNIMELTSQRGMDYLRATLRLLTAHDWQTTAARKLRDDTKKKNIKELSDIISLFGEE